MFGQNEVVGTSYFKDSGDKLFITSVFFTLSGESTFRGWPAIFIRLAKCNLKCSFCDTFFDGGDWYTIEELEEKVNQVISNFFNGNIPEWAQLYDGHKRRMAMIITGGEPMLQKNLVPFLKKMNTQIQYTQIESNGLIWQDIPDETILVCSPKCSERNGKSIKYLNPNKKVLDRADSLKFVMCADQNSPYSSIPDWAHEYAKSGKQVFVSPMNVYNKEPEKSKMLRASKNDITIDERSTVDEVISWWEPGLLDMKANQENHEYTGKYCVRNGFIFNMQLHLFASLA